MSRVLVVGGGPAGLMAAITAANNGHEVVVLERNPDTGKKLCITGKGRCNVTNNCDLNTLIEKVNTNSRFLYSAFSQFDSADTMTFFEKLGVPLKTERGNRVFPQSDNAHDIAGALKRAANRSGVKIRCGIKADKLIIRDGAVCGVASGDRRLDADKVVLACGGRSYPTTGSDGTGYRLAKQAGHSIVEIKPSLVPVITDEKWVAECSGLSLKNVSACLIDEAGKTVYADFGEALFTHFGMSGPIILSMSSHMLKNQKYKILLDLKPALSLKQLDSRLLKEIEENKRSQLSAIYRKLLPSSLAAVFGGICGVSPLTNASEVTKEMRTDICGTLKSISLTVKGLGTIDEAIVTSGGVSTKEINPKTMESKLVRGLYFAGEMIDVDAYTGGFNLQIAFSTGRLAGNSV